MLSSAARPNKREGMKRPHGVTKILYLPVFQTDRSPGNYGTTQRPWRVEKEIVAKRLGAEVFSRPHQLGMRPGGSRPLGGNALQDWPMQRLPIYLSILVTELELSRARLFRRGRGTQHTRRSVLPGRRLI